MGVEDGVEYRGYLLIQRVYPCTATDRIARPDGTWRYSEPTIINAEWVGWVVGQRSADGGVVELKVAVSYAEARL